VESAVIETAQEAVPSNGLDGFVVFYSFW